ncbi:hypothetical protein CF326_g3729 [Tilletia indica]|nr:hypothetical protein CF326_g3729 [Tilletia indica]
MSTLDRDPPMRASSRPPTHTIERQASAIHSAINDSARMAHGLARLELLEMEFIRFVARNRVLLEAAEAENQHQLQHYQEQSKIVYQEIQCRTQQARLNYVADMATFSSQLKYCVSELGRDVRTAQADWMRTQAHHFATQSCFLTSHDELFTDQISYGAPAPTSFSPSTVTPDPPSYTSRAQRASVHRAPRTRTSDDLQLADDPTDRPEEHNLVQHVSGESPSPRS